MKGIARTVVQLIYGSGLQRWLLRIGLCMTILGFGTLKTGWYAGAQPLFAFTGILAAAITVISPIVVGAVMFRALAAPRAVQLMPHGRLKLVLGAFSTQVLLSMFIAASMTTLLTDGPGAHAALLGTTTVSGFMGVICAYAFIVLTFIFLNFYWAMQTPFAAFFAWLLYLFVPELLPYAFPQLHLGALLDTRKGLLTVLTVSLLAWPVFAVGFIKQRQIKVIPDWKLIGPGPFPRRGNPAWNTRALAAPRYSRQQAMRIQLTGIASIRRQSFLIILLVSLAFLAAVLFTARANVPARSAGAYLSAFIICLFTGILQAIRPGIMTRRAKFLWLAARMEREELFRAIETQSWNMVLPVLGTAMALAIAFLAFTIHAMPPPARLVSTLGMPLVTAASGIYVSLLLVRGFRRTDTLFLVGYTALLMVELALATVGSSAGSLPSLLGAQIILLPLLRLIAQRRWRNIDWLVHKNTLAAQLAG
jgi:hypothetical protein